MVFRTRKIPKHLIIHDEYEIRKRPRVGIFKFVLLFTTVVVITSMVSFGVVNL